ncbi:MAG: ribosome maturation factor RimM [Lachnospiraceae bacterium]|nr:ribosome maturation factor RimM [Lachnospiraceae bacterium]
MEDIFKIGIVTTTHGLKGEVKVFPTTDDPARFKKLKQVILCHKNKKQDLTVQSVKFFKNLVIIKFKEFNDISEVEGLRQAELFVTRLNAVPLNENEYYIADLMGMKVVDESGNDVGEIYDVMTGSANDVYCIKTTDDKDLLLPAIKECILNVDVAANTMKVHIMEGLL